MVRGSGASNAGRVVASLLNCSLSLSPPPFPLAHADVAVYWSVPDPSPLEELECAPSVRALGTLPRSPLVVRYIIGHREPRRPPAELPCPSPLQEKPPPPIDPPDDSRRPMGRAGSATGLPPAAIDPSDDSCRSMSRAGSAPGLPPAALSTAMVPGSKFNLRETKDLAQLAGVDQPGSDLVVGDQVLARWGALRGGKDFYAGTLSCVDNVARMHTVDFLDGDKGVRLNT